MSIALRRYTSVNALLDTLLNKRITLLSPASWSDQNDREIMALYANSVPGNHIFAYCMAEGNETAHHWQVFADRGFGACIKFDRDRLIAALNENPYIRHGTVSYVQWRNISVAYGNTRPFIKRSVFRFEKEYRLVATVPEGETPRAAYSVPIPLSCITSVYLSGEIPTPHFETLRTIIKSFPGCGKLMLRQSGLLRNANWSATLIAATNGM